MRTRERWIGIDDFGHHRWVVVEYDERGTAEVSREVMHELLTLAGLRRDAEGEA